MGGVFLKMFMRNHFDKMIHRRRRQSGRDEGEQNASASKREDNVALVRNWGASSDDESEEAGSGSIASTETEAGVGEVEAKSVVVDKTEEDSSSDDGEVDKTEVRTGDVTAAPASSETLTARALADFVGQHQSNIPLTKGQLVRVLGWVDACGGERNIRPGPDLVSVLCKFPVNN